MAELKALQVDNALIQVSGPEMPIMDGSALPMIIGVAFCSAAVAFIAWVPVQRVRLGAAG